MSIELPNGAELQTQDNMGAVHIIINADGDMELSTNLPIPNLHYILSKVQKMIMDDQILPTQQEESNL